MGSVISKWIVPGVITVIAGTAAAVFFSQGPIEADLTQKSRDVLAAYEEQTGDGWAQISFSGRDGTITGVTTDPGLSEEILTRIAALHGVRSITSQITVAPTASPYALSATLNDGTVTLSGAVPSLAARDTLLERSGASDGGLELMSGVPEGEWLSAAGFAISSLEGLQSGAATLSDLSLSVSGIAATPQSYVETLAALEGDLPFGITLQDVAIEPASVENYVFSATHADETTSLSGFVPDEALRRQAGEHSGASTDDLMIARGAPPAFDATLALGLDLLDHLEQGTVEISAQGLSVSGTPASLDDADALAGLIASSAPQGVTLDTQGITLVSVAPYTWSAEKFANGRIVLRGHVPDELTRTALLNRAMEGATDMMRIAAGAPDHFYEDALVAVSALKELESGRAGHSLDGWFLNGQPATQEAKEAAANALITARTLADEWNVAIADAPPVPVVPYAWSAEKLSNGRILLVGVVPDEATRAAILSRAGENVLDRMSIGYGAPDHFYEDAMVALYALKNLETGRTGHGATGWFLFGQPASEQAATDAAGSLITARTPVERWRVELAEPPREETQEESEAETSAAGTRNAADAEEASQEQTTAQEQATAQEQQAGDPATPAMSFSATKADGSITLTGQVPNARVATYLGVVAGGASVNELEKTASAPGDFNANARTGILALRALEEGQLTLQDNVWSLSGKAASAEARDRVLALIGSNEGAGWSTDIALPSPAETCRQMVSAFTQDNTIEFETASARISSASMSLLEDLASFLQQCPESDVHIEGHTDNQGDFISNLKLSSDRADAVVDALVDLGIDEARLYPIGYGQANPIASNDTAQGRQANRRIMFKILD